MNLPSTTPGESRLLRRIKIGGFILLLVFAVQSFTYIPELWPITRWPMYSGRMSYPVQQSDLMFLQVTDAAGGLHRVFIPQLGMLGGRILSSAFDVQDAALRDHYRALLTKRIQKALPASELSDIQLWQGQWVVHKDRFPPFDMNAPDTENFVDSFPAALYTETTPPDSEPDLLFGDSLALLAFRLIGSNEVTACGDIHAQTWWSAIQQPNTDYQITLVLADGGGMGRAQSDGQLALSATSDWSPGQQALDRRSIAIPCDLEVGSYNLLVGLYDLQSVQNLPVNYPDGSPYGHLAYLTTIHVKEQSLTQ